MCNRYWALMFKRLKPEILRYYKIHYMEMAASIHEDFIIYVDRVGVINHAPCIQDALPTGEYMSAFYITKDALKTMSLESQLCAIEKVIDGKISELMLMEKGM